MAGFSNASLLVYRQAQPVPVAAGAHPQNAVVAVEVSHGFPVQHAPLPGSVFDHSTGVHALHEATEKSLLHHVHNLTLAEVSFRHKEVAGVRYEVSPAVRCPAAPCATALLRPCASALL